MIVALASIAAGLTVSLWLCAMFIWWQKERGAHEALATETALIYFEKCTRLARRGWYASEMYAKAVGSWGNKKLQKVFFSVFPNAAPAFAKHDELAGLSHGPSSFFLLSISEKDKTKKVSRKKIVI